VKSARSGGRKVSAGENASAMDGLFTILEPTTVRLCKNLIPRRRTSSGKALRPELTNFTRPACLAFIPVCSGRARLQGADQTFWEARSCFGDWAS